MDTDMSELGHCEVCDNLNGAGDTVCSWCETTLPKPIPARVAPPQGSTGSTRGIYRAVAAVLALAILIAGIVLAVHDNSGSEAAPPAAPEPAATEAAAPAAETADAVTLFNVNPGECVDSYLYDSVLNHTPMAVVPCDSTDALVKFVQKESLDAASSDCVQGGLDWETQDGEYYCFEYLLRTGMCVPALINAGSDSGAWFQEPRSCDDPLPPASEEGPAGSTYQFITITGVLSLSGGGSCSDGETYYDLTTTDRRVCTEA